MTITSNLSRFRRTIAAIASTALLAGACSKDPQAQSREYVTSGDRYAAEKKYKEAVVEYRNAVQADPRSGEARLKLADAYLQVKDAVNAYRETIRAADLLPDDPEAQLKAATMLMLANKFEDARTRAQNALNKDPKNVRAQIILGNATAGLKDLDGAVAEMEEAVKLDPTRANTYAILGAMEFARGKKDAAEAAFKKAVETDPKSVPARLALANYYASSGEKVLAIDGLKAALALEPNNLLTNRALALLAVADGRPADAEPYLKTMAAASDQPEVKLSVADYYLAMGRKEEAAKLLEVLAEKPEMYVPAKIRQASLAAQDDLPRANRILDEALTRDPKAANALEMKARLLLAEGKKEDALVRARAAVAAEPQNVPAQYTLGLTQLALNNVDAAKGAFEETVKLNPRAAAAKMQLARIELASGKAESSGEYARDVLKTDPANPSARLVLVRGLIARGDAVTAEQELTPLTEKYPNVAAVQVMRGMLDLLKRDQPGARRDFTKAVVMDPRNSDAVRGLVMLDLSENKPADARRRIDDFLKQGQPTATGLVLGAEVYARTGDLPRAEGLLRQAIALRPDTLAAYNLLAQVYVSERRLDAARAEYQQVITRQPKSVPAHTIIAMLYHMEQKMPEAEKAYEATLAVDPRAAVAANNLAWIYVDSNRNLDQALQLAQTAKAALPDEPNVNDTLGWIYYKKEMYPQALEALRRSVEKEPTNAIAQYHLGLTLVRLDEREDARKALREALRLNPKFENAADAQKALTQIGG